MFGGAPSTLRLPPDSSAPIACAAARWICLEKPMFACASAEFSWDCTSDCSRALPLYRTSMLPWLTPEEIRAAMSRRDHDGGHHVPGLDVRDRPLARGNRHRADLTEQLIGVLADRHPFAADLDRLPGRRFVDDRHPRLAGRARYRQARSAARSRSDRRPARRPATASGAGSAGPCAAAISWPCPRSRRNATNAASKSPLAAAARGDQLGRGAVEQQLAVGQHDRARGVARTSPRWCVENSTAVPARASSPTNSHSRWR